MDEKEEQLNVESVQEEPAPSRIWKTALGRAVFGFYAETHRNSYFVNDDYIAALCATENKLSEMYGKVILYGFFSVCFRLLRRAVHWARQNILASRLQTFPI